MWRTIVRDLTHTTADPPDWDYDTHAEAKEELAKHVDDHAKTAGTWVTEHDCDDIPCPTYGDDCPTYVVNDLELMAEQIRALPDGEDYSYTMYLAHYQLSKSEDVHGL